MSFKFYKCDITETISDGFVKSKTYKYSNIFNEKLLEKTTLRDQIWVTYPDKILLIRFYEKKETFTDIIEYTKIIEYRVEYKLCNIYS